jgi:hypothetical protein
MIVEHLRPLVTEKGLKAVLLFGVLEDLATCPKDERGPSCDSRNFTFPSFFHRRKRKSVKICRLLDSNQEYAPSAHVLALHYADMSFARKTIVFK